MKMILVQHQEIPAPRLSPRSPATGAIIPPQEGNEGGAIDYARTAGQAKVRSVTVSRPTLSLEFGKLASIITPNFKSMNDQEYHSKMDAAVKRVGTYGRLMGTALAKLIIPGIEDAARRFADHGHDGNYRLNGQPNLSRYVHSLGLKPATIRKWRQRLREQEERIKLLTSNTGAKNRGGKNSKERDKYDAADIAHLERVVRAAQDAADTHPDDDVFDSIRDAIQNKPEGMPEVGSDCSDFVMLALEAFEIVFNDLGGQLMGTTKGKRLVEIAREGLALSRKRLRNRTTPKNLDGREHCRDPVELGQ